MLHSDEISISNSISMVLRISRCWIGPMSCLETHTDTHTAAEKEIPSSDRMRPVNEDRETNVPSVAKRDGGEKGKEKGKEKSQPALRTDGQMSPKGERGKRERETVDV